MTGTKGLTVLYEFATKLKVGYLFKTALLIHPTTLEYKNGLK